MNLTDVVSQMGQMNQSSAIIMSVYIKYTITISTFQSLNNNSNTHLAPSVSEEVVRGKPFVGYVSLSKRQRYWRLIRASKLILTGYLLCSYTL